MPQFKGTFRIKTAEIVPPPGLLNPGTPMECLKVTANSVDSKGNVVNEDGEHVLVFGNLAAAASMPVGSVVEITIAPQG